MKRKQKSLGQIAFDAEHLSSSHFEDAQPNVQASYERMALAVAKEAIIRGVGQKIETERDDYLDTLGKIAENLGYTEEVGKRAEAATGSNKVSDGIEWHVEKRLHQIADERDALAAQLATAREDLSDYRKAVERAASELNCEPCRLFEGITGAEERGMRELDQVQ